MRNNATNIEREAKMLEESKVAKRLKENKNNFYKFVRNKTKIKNSEQFKKKRTLTKCDEETAEVLNSEFRSIYKDGIADRRIERFDA